MDNINKQYTDRLKFIISNGEVKKDRTKTGTISTCLVDPIKVDLRKEFPLIGWKFTPFKLVEAELFWFLSGDTRLKPLLDKGCNIWNDNAYDWYYKQGGRLSFKRFIEEVKGGELQFFELGKIYGHQWRKGRIDQVQNIINHIRANSMSRRLICSAWNVQDIANNEMALPPCHFHWQVMLSGCKKYIDLSACMRSADFGLGVPFNVASYGLLAHWVARQTGKKVRYMRLNFVGDSHISADHLQPITNALVDADRPILENKTKLYKRDGELRISNYKHNGRIQLQMSV